ncbi:cell surface glycoprotein CD200 receptor 1 isoform X3 [Takifugu rubripes]|uniref:cell surface glycoprotein CD200 receptor 1 isoform X3 n=1 Tax=Takifugu rubripes TaxID=31033 RepID=UPI0011457BFB|nr:cell surface glycoprotein CD200 receptor 1 isoform X3 [Takifugu rubripes]
MDVKWILAAFLPLLTEVLSTEKAPLSGLGTNQSSAVAYTSPPPFQYVPPSLSAWLESEGEKMVAVCRAERAKPAANISWSQAGSIVETLLEDGGFFSVESRLELLEGADTENLTCVIDHPYWRDQQILQPALKRGRIPWITIITIVSVFVLLGGVLFYVQKKVVMRYYQQSDGSETKTAPTEEMEEVEPYASYVQRVNSLYNSSAVMFT